MVGGGGGGGGDESRGKVTIYAVWSGGMRVSSTFQRMNEWDGPVSQGAGSVVRYCSVLPLVRAHSTWSKVQCVGREMMNGVVCHDWTVRDESSRAHADPSQVSFSVARRSSRRPAKERIRQVRSVRSVTL